MTSEIVIMNKEAIAIAADSAITLQNERSNKVFISANKIFTLSKYYPVSIMVYQDSQFMGIPWEIIIKTYRYNLDNKSFPRLDDYAKDFIKFFNYKNNLFPASIQDRYLRIRVEGFFLFIKNEITESIKSKIECDKKIDDQGIINIIDYNINNYHNLWEKDADLFDNSSNEFQNTLKIKYKDLFEEIINDIFQNLPLHKKNRELLIKIALNLLTKYSKVLFNAFYSGVVIAGYGQEDFYPSLRSFIFYNVIDNKLMYRIDSDNTVDINNEIIATINPFAQSDMVETFIEGLSPNWHSFIFNILKTLINDYPSTILNSISNINKKDKEKLIENSRKISKQEFKKFKEEFQNYAKSNYITPITSMVASLPKDEIASMAESLVNLTSFKRKISMEPETVGGPVDVAIISKGDGFIWIKRKHYFTKELNPHFFKNYFRKEK